MIANLFEFYCLYGTDVPFVLPDPRDSEPPPMQPISRWSIVRQIRVLVAHPSLLESEWLTCKVAR
jgi:hypothetical protein